MLQIYKKNRYDICFAAFFMFYWHKQCEKIKKITYIQACHFKKYLYLCIAKLGQSHTSMARTTQGNKYKYIDLLT